MKADVSTRAAQCAAALQGEGEVAGGIAFPMQIPRTQLDFSLKSLTALQQYLERVRPHASNLDTQVYQNTLMAAGCYLGEVIRREVQTDAVWAEPAGGGMPVLKVGNQTLTPIAQVQLVLSDSADEDLESYASGHFSFTSDRPAGAATEAAGVDEFGFDFLDELEPEAPVIPAPDSPSETAEDDFGFDWETKDETNQPDGFDFDADQNLTEFGYTPADPTSFTEEDELVEEVEILDDVDIVDEPPSESASANQPVTSDEVDDWFADLSEDSPAKEAFPVQEEDSFAAELPDSPQSEDPFDFDRHSTAEQEMPVMESDTQDLAEFGEAEDFGFDFESELEPVERESAASEEATSLWEDALPAADEPAAESSAAEPESAADDDFLAELGGVEVDEDLFAEEFSAEAESTEAELEIGEPEVAESEVAGPEFGEPEVVEPAATESVDDAWNPFAEPANAENSLSDEEPEEAATESFFDFGSMVESAESETSPEEESNTLWDEEFSAEEEPTEETPGTEPSEVIEDDFLTGLGVFEPTEEVQEGTPAESLFNEDLATEDEPDVDALFAESPSEGATEEVAAASESEDEAPSGWDAEAFFAEEEPTAQFFQEEESKLAGPPPLPPRPISLKPEQEWDFADFFEPTPAGSAAASLSASAPVSPEDTEDEVPVSEANVDDDLFAGLHQEASNDLSENLEADVAPADEAAGEFDFAEELLGEELSLEVDAHEEPAVESEPLVESLDEPSFENEFDLDALMDEPSAEEQALPSDAFSAAEESVETTESPAEFNPWAELEEPADEASVIGQPDEDSTEIEESSADFAALMGEAPAAESIETNLQIAAEEEVSAEVQEEEEPVPQEPVAETPLAEEPELVDFGFGEPESAEIDDVTEATPESDEGFDFLEPAADLAPEAFDFFAEESPSAEEEQAEEPSARDASTEEIEASEVEGLATEEAPAADELFFDELSVEENDLAKEAVEEPVAEETESLFAEEAETTESASIAEVDDLLDADLFGEEESPPVSFAETTAEQEDDPFGFLNAEESTDTAAEEFPAVETEAEPAAADAVDDPTARDELPGEAVEEAVEESLGSGRDFATEPDAEPEAVEASAADDLAVEELPVETADEVAAESAEEGLVSAEEAPAVTTSALDELLASLDNSEEDSETSSAALAAKESFAAEERLAETEAVPEPLALQAAEIEKYLAAAAKGDAAAQFELGRIYEEGLFAEDNFPESVRRYQEAADGGHTGAMARLGHLYYLGQGVSQNWTKGVQLFLKAAKSGEPLAQQLLGMCLEHGKGAQRDMEKALRCYYAGANADAPACQVNLGLCYLRGRGLKQQVRVGARWLNKAADHSFGPALFLLGACHEGGVGVERDEAQAEEYYQRAAAAGFAFPEGKWSIRTSHGKANAADAVDPIWWVRLAADAGEAWAQHNMGLFYRSGHGVRESASKTIHWFQLAAKSGFAPAQYELGRCFENATGAPRDLGRAIKWYIRSAEAGYAPAQSRLAIFYECGLGVKRNAAEAAKWQEQAEKQQAAV